MEEDDKKKLVALGILIVVLVAVWYIVLFGMPGGGGGTGAAEQQETAQKQESDTNQETGNETEQDKEDKKDELTVEKVATLLESVTEALKKRPGENGEKISRDPFHFASVPKPPVENLPELKVTVILSSSGKGTAVINGEAVSEGDTLGPDGHVEVKEIKDNTVTVVYSEKGRSLEKTLTLE